MHYNDTKLKSYHKDGLEILFSVQPNFVYLCLDDYPLFSSKIVNPGWMEQEKLGFNVFNWFQPAYNQEVYKFQLTTRTIYLLNILIAKFTLKRENLKDMADTISIDTLALQKSLEQTRTKEISQLESLSKKVYYLHTDLLYYRKINSTLGTSCYEAWKVLMKKVGGTPNGWRDLGYALGVSQDDLDFIMAQVQDDHTDMVLKVFRQSEKATLDKIVDAFIKLQRYDILKSLEDPLCNIAQYFSKDDSGYQSNEKSTGHREIVRLKNMANDLPAALNKNMVIQQKDPDKNKHPMMKPATNTKAPIKNDSPILFLTFAQDGLPTAINIKDYVDSWTDIQGVNVITLNCKRDEIYQNPEKYIREYFEKADFIVPIITPGYLEEIQSHRASPPNTTENLDHKYVNFIYNLIVNQYIHAAGCLNKKVRSVLPQNSRTDLFMNITMYPDLMPWTYETCFDEQFQAFLKKDSS